MELERAQRTAEAVVKRLSPYCKKDKIAVAGSVRRKKPQVRDIDLVLIPNDLWDFHAELTKLGSLKMSGKKIMRVMRSDIQVSSGPAPRRITFGWPPWPRKGDGTWQPVAMASSMSVGRGLPAIQSARYTLPWTCHGRSPRRGGELCLM
ncbi:hypothetical protein ES703_102390 [subsurface metagenome]